MALIKCKECGNEVSKKAKTCPKCGAPVKQSSSLGVVLLVGGVLIFLAVTIAPNMDSGKSKSPSRMEYERALRIANEAGNEIANEVAAARKGPPLELISWRCESEHGYMYVRGQVKNVSSHSLKNVMAVGTFKTKSGQFIKSSDALIEYNPILPGQTSPFETGATRNPAFAQCNIDFKELMGGTINFTTPKARVKKVQEALDQLGYDVGIPDGIMGPKTRNAIKKFQKENGMNIDGKVSNTLLSKLMAKM